MEASSKEFICVSEEDPPPDASQYAYPTPSLSQCNPKMKMVKKPLRSSGTISQMTNEK